MEEKEDSGEESIMRVGRRGGVRLATVNDGSFLPHLLLRPP